MVTACVHASDNEHWCMAELWTSVCVHAETISQNYVIKVICDNCPSVSHYVQSFRCIYLCVCVCLLYPSGDHFPWLYYYKFCERDNFPSFSHYSHWSVCMHVCVVSHIDEQMSRWKTSLQYQWAIVQLWIFPVGNFPFPTSISPLVYKSLTNLTVNQTHKAGTTQHNPYLHTNHSKWGKIHQTNNKRTQNQFFETIKKPISFTGK